MQQRRGRGCFSQKKRGRAALLVKEGLPVGMSLKKEGEGRLEGCFPATEREQLHGRVLILVIRKKKTKKVLADARPLGGNLKTGDHLNPPPVDEASLNQ